MCIIIHKPKGKTVDRDTLKRCWNRNSHGAGFMFVDDDKVYGNKGYMSFQALIDGLANAGFYRKGKKDGSVKGELIADYAVTIHFRLASHGGIKPSNCHPFPVTDELDVLQARFWEANCGVAHNGIISIERDNKEISDTMTYIMYRLSETYSQLDEINAYEEMELETSGSRMFVLYPDGHYVISGTWVEEDGVLYSNGGFRKPTNVVRHPSSMPMFNQPEYRSASHAWCEEMQAKAGLARKERHAPPGMKWVTAK